MWFAQVMGNEEEVHSKSDASASSSRTSLNSMNPATNGCCRSLPGTPTPFSAMPPWLRFSPSDKHFLLGKILGSLCSSDYEQCGVHDCDLYGKEEPWEIWERFRGSSSDHLTVPAQEDEDLYLFTELKKVSVKGQRNKGQRIDRRVGKGDGNWHVDNAGVQIVVKTDEFSLGAGFVGLEGRRKQFSYRGSSCSNGFRWIMHEFSLSWPKEAATHIGSNSMVVLCRISSSKNKVSPSYAASTEAISSSLPSRKRKSEDDERALAIIDLESSNGCSSQATITLTDPIPKRVRRENEKVQEATQAGAVLLLDTPITTTDPPLDSSNNSSSRSDVGGGEIVDPVVQELVVPVILDGDFDSDEDDKHWRDLLSLEMDSPAFDFNWEVMIMSA